MKNKSLLILLGASLSLAACDKGGESANPDEAPAADPAAEEATEPETAETPADVGNIIEVATAAGTFNTLATALTEAGLVETLQGEGPFTVFAPTDEAFAAIPEADLNALLADKEKLTKVLTYHVVSGNVPSSDVAGMTEATAVSGDMLKIDTSSGVMINDATVTQADIAASNGVIHVIDKVLMPPM